MTIICWIKSYWNFIFDVWLETFFATGIKLCTIEIEWFETGINFHKKPHFYWNLILHRILKILRTTFQILHSTFTEVIGFLRIHFCPPLSLKFDFGYSNVVVKFWVIMRTSRIMLTIFYGSYSKLNEKNFPPFFS